MIPIKNIYSRCGLASYFGTKCKLRTLISFEPAPSTTEPPTTTVATPYTTTSTARPPPGTTEVFRLDPLRGCDIPGVPESKELGDKEIQELVKYKWVNNLLCL